MYASTSAIDMLGVNLLSSRWNAVCDRTPRIAPRRSAAAARKRAGNADRFPIPNQDCDGDARDNHYGEQGTDESHYEYCNGKYTLNSHRYAWWDPVSLPTNQSRIGISVPLYDESLSQ